MGDRAPGTPGPTQLPPGHGGAGSGTASGGTSSGPAGPSGQPDRPGPAGGPPAADPAGAAAKPESLIQVAMSLWRELPGLVSDRVELLSLELRRAGIALAQIVVLIVAAAILGVTAWLVLWGSIVVMLTALGLHLGWALLAALLFNLLAAAVAVMRVRTLLPRLQLPATRRHLVLSPSPRPTRPDVEGPRPPSPHERPDIAPAGQPAAS